MEIQNSTPTYNLWQDIGKKKKDKKCTPEELFLFLVTLFETTVTATKLVIPKRNLTLTKKKKKKDTK